MKDYARKQDKDLTIEEVAQDLMTTRKRLSAIINGKQAITPEMAIKLATAFKSTSAEFWLRAQENYNLAQARKNVDTRKIRVFWKPQKVL